MATQEDLQLGLANATDPSVDSQGDLSDASIQDTGGLSQEEVTYNPIGSGAPAVKGRPIGPVNPVVHSLFQWKDVARDENGKPILNPDGKSVTTDQGTKLFGDGHIEYQRGGKLYSVDSPFDTPKDVTPSGGMLGKHPRTQIKDFTDPATGEVHSSLIDMDTGKPVAELPNPSSRPAAQREMLRLRIINAAKQQPGIVAYINVKNNYDSLVQNSSIPPDQRTPADDAAAIQAFGAIEHPGTGVTDADKKQAAAIVPWKNWLKIKYDNLMKNKANVLDAQAVNQMKDAAKRALDGRQQTYNDELAPLLKEASRMGLSPEEVNGAMGLLHDQASTPTASPPAPTPVPSPAPVSPNLKIGDQMQERSTGKVKYYTGANPQNRYDQSNWSDTPPQ